MAAASDAIHIVGLREFRAELRALDASLPRGVRQAGNEAADIIVRDAKPKVPLGPGKGGHARDSIRARSTQSWARVFGGGARFPYYPWLDFGGPKDAQAKPRPPHRPMLKTGRFIWRSWAIRRDEVNVKLQHGLADLARQAGLDVD